jgi:hypothetical protein
MFKDEAKKTIRDILGMRRAAGEFGIELELEGRDLRNVEYPHPQWTFHEEGSLRNGGVEVVSKVLKIAQVEDAVNAVATAITRTGAEVDPNAHRPSTHIHSNAQDKPLGDVFGLVCVFHAVEPLWFRLCGDKRDGNAFCLPNYDSGFATEWVMQFCKSLERIGRDGFFIPELGKYASLGFQRFNDLGSIEFRCFPQCTDGAKVLEWCSWIENLWRLVENCEDKTFRSILKQGIRDPHWLAGEVFGQSIFRANIDPRTISELIQFGIRSAYEISRLLNKFYLRTVEQAKKEKKKPQEGEMIILNEDGVAEWGPAFEAPPQPVLQAANFAQAVRGLRRG